MVAATMPSQRPSVIALSYYRPNISGMTEMAAALAMEGRARDGRPARIVCATLPDAQRRLSRLGNAVVLRARAVARVGKAPVMPGRVAVMWRAPRGAQRCICLLPNADAALDAIAARLRGVPLVIGYATSMSRRTIADRLLRLIAAPDHLVAGLLAKRIVVVSEQYAAQSTFCRLFHRKLVFSPVPSPLCPPPEGIAPRPARAPNAPYRIGMVGRIARQKSLDTLFAALPHAEALLDKPLQLDLVGPGESVIGETKWARLAPIIAASNGRIRALGVLPERDLLRFYREIDLLVLPSQDRLESFGLVQVEAMTQGTPVVACDLPGIRTPIARTGFGRLVPPGDAAAMGRAIAEILLHGPPNRPSLEEILAIFGRETAAAPYFS